MARAGKQPRIMEVDTMPHWAMERLRSAVAQMDLLLETPGIDDGLGHLLGLLQDLQAVRKAVNV